MGAGVRSVRLAHLNDDLIPDVAVISGATPSVLLSYLGGETGQFEAAGTALLGQDARGLVIVDFDTDGVQDAVAANSGDGSFSLLRSLGDGTFDALEPLAVGPSPRAVAIHDLNGDGLPDLAVTDIDNHEVKVFVGVTPGEFALCASYSVGEGPHGLVTADVDDDGVQDLLTANLVRNSVSVLIGESAPSAGNYRSPRGDFSTLSHNENGTHTRRLKSGTEPRRVDDGTRGSQREHLHLPLPGESARRNHRSRRSELHTDLQQWLAD